MPLLVAGILCFAPSGEAAVLRVAEAKASVHEELTAAPESNLPGVVQTLRPPEGSAFLAVDVRLKVEWDPDERTVAIKGDQIALADGQGGKHPWVGTLTPTGHFRRYASSLYLRKAYGKKGAGARHPFVGVFAVPKGAKTFILTLGELDHRLEATPGEQPPSPADFAAFKVVSAKLVDEALGPQSLGYKKPKATRAIHPVVGRLLAVELEIAPKRGNATHGPYLHLNTWDLGLTFGKGAYAPAVGQIHGDFGYTNNVSMNFHPQPDGSWKPSTYTVYFAVPEDVEDFAVTYLQAAVAKGTVGE